MEVCNLTVREKCLHRLHRRIERLALVALACGVSSGVAQQADPVPARPPMPAVLESFLEHVDTLSASFDQELWSSDQRLIELSKGTFSLKRPNRFRWSYIEPIETLIVTDGATLWMYDVDIAQVTRADLDEDAPASPAMLLSGDKAVRDSFDIVDTDQRDGVTWISLAPNFSGSEFSVVRLGFDGDMLSGMELVNGLDQTTSIHFTDVQVNTDLDDGLFEFDVPPGVSVLGSSG